MQQDSKSINTLVIDAGPIIRNQPAVSSLLAAANEIVTLPAVVSEIRDPAARSRLDTTLKPFLTLRDPKPDSVNFVQAFARKTGDLSVLSTPDLRLIALAYEIELERNGGDWRLRNTPGQKTLNGPLPAKASENPDPVPAEQDRGTVDSASAATATTEPSTSNTTAPLEPRIAADSNPTASLDEDDSDSDSDGWITPSNLAKHEAHDAGASLSPSAEPKIMQVATLTSDFAMQNVLLQINLNLLSPTLQRVRHLKSFIKRCHACFMQVKDMDKQFCPRCGKDTLTKVACSTNANGEFQIHLKKNMQWNNRGNRFSIPKAVHGSASGKVDGGGKGGWGNGLILTEDQKEYVRAMGQQRRTKQKDLMDEDTLPAILTGDRTRAGGRLKVGAGRDVNANKRR